MDNAHVKKDILVMIAQIKHALMIVMEEEDVITENVIVIQDGKEKLVQIKVLIENYPKFIYFRIIIYK